jgi:competence protein ComEC
MGLDKNTFGQIVALTLGDRQFLSPEIKQLYREAGASHLLALSGMHLGILYGAFRL